MKPQPALKALGPVTSSWGMKTWQLLLRRDEIIAWPYTWTEELSLGFLLEIGIGRDAGLVFSTNDPRAVAAAIGGRKVRRYAVSDITSITLTCSSLRNCVAILEKGGIHHSYGILDRHLTDEYRRGLHSLYPNQYTESGFPTNLWQRFLKY